MSGTIVEFYKKKILHKFETEKKEREAEEVNMRLKVGEEPIVVEPIFIDKVYVKKRVVGERDTVDRPATQKDYNEYPDQYQSHLRLEDHKDGGVLVEKLPFLDDQDVIKLKTLNIHTVDHLASVADVNTKKLGIGGRSWVKKANEYVAAHKSVERVEDLEKELKSLRAEMTKLKKKSVKESKDVSSNDSAESGEKNEPI